MQMIQFLAFDAVRWQVGKYKHLTKRFWKKSDVKKFKFYTQNETHKD